MRRSRAIRCRCASRRSRTISARRRHRPTCCARHAPRGPAASTCGRCASVPRVRSRAGRRARARQPASRDGDGRGRAGAAVRAQRLFAAGALRGAHARSRQGTTPADVLRAPRRPRGPQRRPARRCASGCACRTNAAISRWSRGEHGNLHRVMEMGAAALVWLFERSDALRKPARFAEMLQACESDARGGSLTRSRIRRPSGCASRSPPRAASMPAHARGIGNDTEKIKTPCIAHGSSRARARDRRIGRRRKGGALRLPPGNRYDFLRAELAAAGRLPADARGWPRPFSRGAGAPRVPPARAPAHGGSRGSPGVARGRLSFDVHRRRHEPGATVVEQRQRADRDHLGRPRRPRWRPDAACARRSAASRRATAGNPSCRPCSRSGRPARTRIRRRRARPIPSGSLPSSAP